MSVILLERNRLYSKEIGVDFTFMTEKPPIQAGKEVLLAVWDINGEVEFLTPRTTTFCHLQKFPFGLRANTPKSYCWVVADQKDQKLVRDWGKKLGYELAAAEYVAQRVTDYDSEKSPFHSSDCLARIQELKKDLLGLNLGKRRFQQVNSILSRAQLMLERMIRRWQNFRDCYLDVVGSNRVDELVALRLMKKAKRLVCVRQRSVYLGLVLIGKHKLLVSTSRPADAVTYDCCQAEVGYWCKAPLTGIETGSQPEGAIVVKKIRATNQDDIMWMNPAPFGIRTTRPFSSADTVNVFLVDPPSNLYIGDMQK